MKVLLAIEEFHPTSKSVKMAQQILGEVAGSEIVVLYVSNDFASVYYRTNAGIQCVLTEKESRRRDELELAARAEFHQWSERVKFRHEIGHPDRVICEVADEEHVDFVILGGSHFHSNRPRMKSVVRSVVNHANRPVLVAK